jgi:hypothetical protein
LSSSRYAPGGVTDRRERVSLSERLLRSTPAQILISLVQVLNGIAFGFAIPLPPLYAQMLRWLSAIQLELPTLLSLNCFVTTTLHDELVLQTAVPLGIVMVLALLACALHRASRDAASSTAGRLSEACVSLIVIFLFLIYPSTVAKIFSAFACTPVLEDGHSYLRADVRIDCDSASHQQFVSLWAAPMALAYPVGVPVFLLVLLWRERKRLAHWQREEARAVAQDQLREFHVSAGERAADEGEEQTAEDVRALARADERLPQYTKRVAAGYELRCCWFEVVEMGRKLALVGLAVLFEAGGLVQLMYGLVVCFVSFGVLSRIAPYESVDVDTLAQVCQLQIFVTLAAKVVLEADLADVHGMDGMLVAFTTLNTGLALYVETPLPLLLAFVRLRLLGCFCNEDQVASHAPGESSEVSVGRLAEDSVPPLGGARAVRANKDEDNVRMSKQQISTHI